jgi:anti-anti-sigma regulatory factor
MTLRIQKSIKNERVILHLAGRIRGDQVRELRTLLESEVPGTSLALDLSEVKLVDRDAVRFLAQRQAEGTSLINCPAFIREWILQEGSALQRAQAESPEAERD